MISLQITCRDSSNARCRRLRPLFAWPFLPCPRSCALPRLQKLAAGVRRVEPLDPLDPLDPQSESVPIFCREPTPAAGSLQAAPQPNAKRAAQLSARASCTACGVSRAASTI